MRKSILTLALSGLFISLFAQQDSALRNFKFRNASYRAVTFNLSGGSQYNKTNFVVGESKFSSSSFGTGGSYYLAKSTDRILLTMSGALSFGFSASNSDNVNNSQNKNNSLQVSPYFSINNKWFSKNRFTELGTEISAGVSKNEYTSGGVEQRNNTGNASFRMVAGIGKGRLENITDMQNALWLYDALQKEGQLARSLTPAELNELGRTITKANNTRVLDTRRRTRFVLETIDSYFQQSGLISKTDIKYFSNLNDIVFFASNDPRLSGTEWFVRVRPGISIYNGNSKQLPSETKEDGNMLSGQLSTGVNRHVPLSLKKQNNYGAVLYANYYSNDYNMKFIDGGVVTTEIEFDAALKQAGASLFFEHAIYPNTRTIINFRFDANGGYQDLEEETSLFGLAGLSGRVNYFISYRTRLTCEAGADYQKNVYEISRYFLQQPERVRLYANAGIQVSL